MAANKVRKSTININVEMDDNNVPEKITWEATDNQAKSACKAFMLSVWDEKESNAMRVDLWSKDMKVDEMKLFVHQTIATMADTFERATSENQMAQEMKDFADYFAEKMQLYKKN